MANKKITEVTTITSIPTTEYVYVKSAGGIKLISLTNLINSISTLLNGSNNIDLSLSGSTLTFTKADGTTKNMTLPSGGSSSGGISEDRVNELIEEAIGGVLDGSY